MLGRRRGSTSLTGRGALRVDLHSASKVSSASVKHSANQLALDGALSQQFLHGFACMRERSGRIPRFRSDLQFTWQAIEVRDRLRADLPCKEVLDGCREHAEAARLGNEALDVTSRRNEVLGVQLKPAARTRSLSSG
jgi:hypothetical protein